MTDERLERELRELRVQWPETPDLSAVVMERIADPDVVGQPSRSPRRRRSSPAGLAWRPGFAYGLVGMLVAFAVVMAASPTARSAVLEFFGLSSVKIERREPTATPRAAARLGSDLNLGTQTTLREARKTVPFEIVVPAQLGEPDVVYLATLPVVGDAVHLVYGPRTGIATSSNTGASLLISEFPATVAPLIEKAAGGAAKLTRLKIDGHDAYFLQGAHGFAFADENGTGGAFEEQRLAGNTLLVERAGLLVRIEGEVSRGRAVGLVRSLR